MPLKRCQSKGKPGFKYGDEGTCYTYTAGNQEQMANAKRNAINQGIAMGEIDINESENKKNNTTKKGGEINMDQEQLNELLGEVKKGLGDKINDLVTKALEAEETEEEGSQSGNDGEGTSDNEDDSAAMKAVNALSSKMEKFISTMEKREKNRILAEKKDAYEKQLNATLEDAVKKALELASDSDDDEGEDDGESDEQDVAKSKKKSKVNGEKDADNDKNYSKMSVSDFRSLPEAERDKAVNDAFRKAMGVDALKDIRKHTSE